MEPTKFRITDVTPQNVDMHDLFCLKSKKKEAGYQMKLEWFKEHYVEGVRVKLLEIFQGDKKGYVSRGFIEYAPGSASWRGVDAPNYTVIHCIWVVGKNKRQGYGSLLLEECIKDSKERDGVTVVTSPLKWIADRRLFVKQGFEKTDEHMGFELYTLRFHHSAATPRFHRSSEAPKGDGFNIVASYQCPYHVDAARLIEERAGELGVPFRLNVVKTASEAQNGPSPYGAFCVCRDGRFVTHSYLLKKDIPA